MTIPPQLPPDLRAALARLAHGVSRRAMAGRAMAQSRAYRSGGSSRPIATTDDALAYAFTRLPATYAAAAAVFNTMTATLPWFRPRTMLDVGAGPGTAAFAALAAWDGIAHVDLIDANAALRRLALELMAAAGAAALRTAAQVPSYRLGDALTLLADAAPADLVTVSYAAGEIAPRDLDRFGQLLWERTAGALAIIMPGTPDGHAVTQRLRGGLIAAGAHVAAPCPHDRRCPLGPTDWCHFGQRLPRSRDHLQVKGAEVPFEDEKFCYAVLSRTPGSRPPARVLAPPKLTKAAVTAKLCRVDGVAAATTPRRDGEAFRRARSWRWGDGVDPGGAPKRGGVSGETG